MEPLVTLRASMTRFSSLYQTSNLNGNLMLLRTSETFVKTTLRTTNIDDDDDDGGCPTPIALFYAACSMTLNPVPVQESMHTPQALGACLAREPLPTPLPAIVNEAQTKAPYSKQSAPESLHLPKQCTTEPIPDPNLVTWDENDPASPHSKSTISRPVTWISPNSFCRLASASKMDIDYCNCHVRIHCSDGFHNGGASTRHHQYRIQFKDQR